MDYTERHTKCWADRESGVEDNQSVQAYEGVATEHDYKEIQRLRRDASSVILFLMFGESKAALGGPDERYSGRVSEQMLETRIVGLDARIPWKAVTAHVASSTMILLVIGQLCLPIARSFFVGEQQWQDARRIIERNVAAVPTGGRFATPWRTVVLWLALLVVIFLAWHFAQVPSGR